ncbi:Endonuclease-reverse transcriptase/Reverse transcriptase (RNA-dependent DNA polymerase) [Novymonas esmeraldas]|uniref:Endonuclease-reverse transcriptase/Reverse transcriptase (RNA-dependent DNA polymerase) n=1 Tax=Novymonas esmeraldas TaxID=1808958 RepID=A0AAW0EU73_9TRYP
MLGDNGALLEWQCADIQDSLLLHTTRICNVYVRPGASAPVDAWLVELVSQLRPDIIGGDFNARHERWSPGARLSATETFARGDKILAFLEHTLYRTSHSPGLLQPTTTRESAVDFFLLAPGVRPTVHLVFTPCPCPSDHYMVVLAVPCAHAGCIHRRQRQIRWHLVTEAHHRLTAQRLRGGRDIADVMSRCHRCRDSLPRGALRSRYIPVSFVMTDVHDPTEAWRAFQKLHEGVPPCVPLTDPATGQRYVTARAKATELNKVFTAKHCSDPAGPMEPPSPMEFPTIGTPAPSVLRWEVDMAFKGLRNKGAPDNDGFTPRLLKWWHDALREPLSSAFSAILDTPTLMPVSWRFSTFVPLLKEGKAPESVTSYRPICITSLLSRLLEKVVVARLVGFLRGRMSPNQYGYVAGRSPLDALGHFLGTAHLVHDRPRKSAPKSHVGYWSCAGKSLAGYLDLSDAFCRVPHAQLLSALRKREVPTYLIRFIRYWLWDRKASTFVNGRKSPVTTMWAGVPQGSVLGPYLFTIFLDDLVASTVTLTRTISAPFVCHAEVVVYVDDFTVLVSGYEIPGIVSCMNAIVQHVFDWCGAHNMVLSPKSVFQWLEGYRNVIPAYLRRLSLTALPPIKIVRRPPPAASMAIPATRGIASSPRQVEEVLFPTTHGVVQRYLGVMIDSSLTYAAHMRHLRQKGTEFVSRLSPLLPYLHPRVARSLAYTGAEIMLYGIPLLLGRLADTYAHTCLQPTWNQLMRRCGGIVRTTSTSDVLVEMGVHSLDMMMRRRAIQWNHRRNTLPIFEVTLTQQLCDEFYRARGTPAIPRTHDPVSCFGHLYVPHLLPTLYPPTPVPATADKVHFLPPFHIAKSRLTPAQMLEANEKARAEAYRQLAGCFVLEGWCDGSWDTEDDGTEKAGGAAAVFLPASDATVPHVSVHCAVPLLSCSYTAEVYAALKLLELLRAVATEHAERPHKAALICTDSLSWLTHAAKGPHTPGPLTPLLWLRLCDLAEKVDHVLVCHAFSHCDDPRGDVIDKLAEEARDANRRLPSAWHRDAARHAARAPLQALITNVLSNRSQFHQEFRPELDTWSNSARGLPPIQLKIKQAVMILQLRTGYWPSLGPATFVRASLALFRCPRCAATVDCYHGGAVRHILWCALMDGHPLAHWLWSGDASVLRGVIARALEFLPSDRRRLTPGTASTDDPS